MYIGQYWCPKRDLWKELTHTLGSSCTSTGMHMHASFSVALVPEIEQPQAIVQLEAVLGLTSSYAPFASEPDVYEGCPIGSRQCGAHSYAVENTVAPLVTAKGPDESHDTLSTITSYDHPPPPASGVSVTPTPSAA